MNVGAAQLASPRSCPSCGGPVDVKRSRHVAIAGTAVLVYCSDPCLRARDLEPETDLAAADLPRRRAAWWLVGGLVAGAAGFVLFYSPEAGEPGEQTPTIAAIVQAALQPPPVEHPRPATKPVPPPPDPDAALIADLAHDAWIHPLAGPDRRMPGFWGRAFGAVRPGDRPSECVSGHCGVDIGRVWGEPVHAVHDGVVDWVNRGPNEEHGGIFVKIAHRGGTLYSWYFHLAAVPRWVQPGVKVRVGQVIGLLGDTGVFHSAPHLHFSLSVKTSPTAHEHYIDPEPLIAIWPLWIPDAGGEGGHLMTAATPGIPVRDDRLH